MAADEVRTQIVERIAVIMEYYDELKKRLKLGRFGGVVTADDYAEFNGMCLALIDRASGRRDAVYEQAVREIERFDLSSSALAASFHGLVAALKRDIDAGTLRTLREAERADVFADLLQVASSLLGDGRTDAAAVLLGSVLVTHLRGLGTKHGLIAHEPSDLTEQILTALEALDAELVGVAYGKLTQQGVTDGLKLWHAATSGATGAYGAAKVALFLDWLRGFIAKYPA